MLNVLLSFLCHLRKWAENPATLAKTFGISFKYGLNPYLKRNSQLSLKVRF